MSLQEGLEEQTLFLQEWPLSRLENITLEEYTNLGRDTSFTYWLEKKTEHSGSIWGGSAFKFGIYKRADTQKVQDYENRRTDGVYAWFAKYGESRDKAFLKIKEIILSIAKASKEGNFKVIDTADLGESVKWKIAFHYHPEGLVPLFKKEVLIRAAEKEGLPEAKKSPTSALQEFLIGKKPETETTLEYSYRIWNLFNLDNFYSIITRFLEQAQTINLKKVGYPKAYHGLEVKVSFGAGASARIPWIAFLQPPNTVSDGIYPVYLYYKEVNVLILAYGLSETTQSANQWRNESELQTISQWYFDKYNKKPDRYGASYVKAVYELDEELDANQVQKDLNELTELYKGQTFTNEPVTSTDHSESTRPKVWVISPGEQARKWDEFYNDGIIGLNWDKIDDLNKFDERNGVRQQLLDLYPEGSKSQSNNSLALWQFSHEMKPGDILIAKKGTSYYLGYGRVSSDYYYDQSRPEYKHLRQVEWKIKGQWEENSGPIVIKTLTDITGYPDYVDRLKRLIGIDQEAVIPQTINYWWLNFSPKYWSLKDYEIGQTISYATFNSKGIQRKKYEYFERMRPGDLVIGFETSPVNKAVAILEVTEGIHLDEDDGDEKITMLLQWALSDNHSLVKLKELPALSNSEVRQPSFQSVHALKKEEYSSIVEMEASVQRSAYTMTDALKDIFIEGSELEAIKTNLLYKKNIILQGPPGTGKTFMAKRLAYLLLEELDDTKIEMVQFHQSYAYEDFMQGYKPTQDGGFKLLSGVFYRFCKKAQSDPDNKYFFIIDEINRGNLSKIFGELMLLLEADKRGPKNAVSLTYGTSNDSKFYIPANLFVIGTMNTADRSLAVVDYALRRRFAFITVNPSFTQSFQNDLINKGVDEGIVQKIVERISFLNQQITSDANLGNGFQIGHSYFCNLAESAGDENWYQFIVKYEIDPLLREYWFDNSETVEKMISHLSK